MLLLTAPTLPDTTATVPTLPDTTATAPTLPDTACTASANPGADQVNASLTYDEDIVPIELRPQQLPVELTADDIRQRWLVIKNKNMLFYVSTRNEYYYCHACTQKHLGEKMLDAHKFFVLMDRKSQHKSPRKVFHSCNHLLI